MQYAQQLKIEQVLTFKINNSLFCIPVDQVESVIEMPEITELPQTPDYIAGTFKHRNKVALAVKLHRILGISETENSRRPSMVVAYIGNRPVGLWIDEIKGLIDSTKCLYSELPPMSANQGLREALLYEGEVIYPVRIDEIAHLRNVLDRLEKETARNAARPHVVEDVQTAPPAAEVVQLESSPAGESALLEPVNDEQVPAEVESAETAQTITPQEGAEADWWEEAYKAGSEPNNEALIEPSDAVEESGTQQSALDVSTVPVTDKADEPVLPFSENELIEDMVAEFEATSPLADDLNTEVMASLPEPDEQVETEPEVTGLLEETDAQVLEDADLALDTDAALPANDAVEVREEDVSLADDLQAEVVEPVPESDEQVEAESEIAGLLEGPGELTLDKAEAGNELADLTDSQDGIDTIELSDSDAQQTAFDELAYPVDDYADEIARNDEGLEVSPVVDAGTSQPAEEVVEGSDAVAEPTEAGIGTGEAENDMREVTDAEPEGDESDLEEVRLVPEDERPLADVIQFKAPHAKPETEQDTGKPTPYVDVRTIISHAPVERKKTLLGKILMSILVLLIGGIVFWRQVDWSFKQKLIRQLPPGLQEGVSKLITYNMTISRPEEGPDRLVVDLPEHEIRVIHTDKVDPILLKQRYDQKAKIYKVQKGDTLWAIAERFLDNPYSYPELAKNSDIRKPDLIYPGDIVTISRKIPE